jgi:hypothetical protein
LNRLLADLLSEKAQCFIRYNEARQLQAVVITRFIQDLITGEKSLLINTLYSFQSVGEDEWKSNMDVIEKFARNTKCKNISTYSNVSRVYELASSLGFNELFRCFVKEL